MQTISPRARTLALKAGRLAHAIQRLEQENERFVYYRVLTFLAAGLATVVAFWQLGSPGGWLVMLATGMIFLGVVNLHQRRRAGLERHRFWLSLTNAQLARLQVNWEQIPLPLWMPPEARGPLATDLDLTGSRSLHHLLDVSVSYQGSQRLAEWLTSDQPDLPTLGERQQVVRELAPMALFRQRLLLLARQAARDPIDGENFLAWLRIPYPAERLRWLLPVAAALTLTNVILFLLSSLAGFANVWVVTLLIYVAFYFFNSGYLSEFLEAVIRMDGELDGLQAVLKFVEGYPLARQPHTAALCAPLRTPGRQPARFLRRLKWITAGAGLRMNPVVGLLLNAVVPWDFAVAAYAGRVRRQAADLLPDWLETLYSLESLAGLANLAYLNPGYALPEFKPQAAPVFSVVALGHPLIPPQEKITNNLSLYALGEILVITGSNMAGKSTFLKTIGINLCLAYAGGPVNAAAFSSRPFRLHTCMRISDSLADGFSYFYAEVKCLKALLQKVILDESAPLLFLVDEIFRGTNNRERLIGSRSYLRALIGQHGTGLIATHDLELAALADEHPQVGNFHFREEVEDGRLVFDYQLRPGPSPTTNALKIMQMEGLPVEPED